MPVVAMSCPPNKEKFGEVHDPEYCVTTCNEQCYSPFLMTAIYGLNQRNYHIGRYVSATALSGCKRRLACERTVDYAESYENLYAGFRGTVVHTVVEEALATTFPSGRTLADMGYLAEWRMIAGFCLLGHAAFEIDPETDVDDLATYAKLECPSCKAAGVALKDQKNIILGGTLDGGAPVFRLNEWSDDLPVIYVDEEGTAHYKLSDIKTMKEFALSYFIKGDPKNTLHPQIKDDYIRQARVYSYLASRAKVPEALAKRGIKRIKFIRADIQAFAMGEAPWTGGGTFRWKDHFKNPLKDWPMYPIDLGEDAWVEEYITTNALPILDSLILGNTRAPVVEPDGSKNHHWICGGYCAFAGSDYCPNPAVEWAALQQGMSPDDAFNAALQIPMPSPEVTVAALDSVDRQNVENFYRKQRGEEATTEKRPRKPRAPRKKKEEVTP